MLRPASEPLPSRASLPVPAVRLDARAQRLEEIGRRLPLRLRLDVDLLALSLPVDHPEQRRAIRVLVLLRLERAAEAVDEVECHRELLLADLRLPRSDVVRRPDLIGEEHLLEDDDPVAHAAAAELCLARFT